MTARGDSAVDGGAAAGEAPPRPFRSLLSAVFVFLLLLLATFGLRGWQDVSRARSRERALAAEVAATEARIAELQRRIERLKSDPTTLDRMAREELGLVSPDDVVIVLPQRKPRGAAATVAP